MKKNLLLFFLALFPVLLFGQVIRGHVYKEGTDSVIEAASVYYGGSLTGTVTNSEGYFALTLKPGKIPFQVSCIGYYSTIVQEYDGETPLKIYLSPKPVALNMISLKAGYDGMSIADKLHLFRKEFLGTTDLALSCKILNIDDVRLTYNSTTKTLNAFCNKAILVENKKLGYQVSYYLDKFKVMPDKSIFEGNYLFKDIAPPGDRAKISRNRKEAYEGSKKQFIRALWSNTLAQNGFSIYLPHFRPLLADSILHTRKPGEKYVHLTYDVTIVHNNNRWLATTLTQTTDESYIDRNGFYDAGLLWMGGSMSLQRVGDLLPYEYQPGN